MYKFQYSQFFCIRMLFDEFRIVVALVEIRMQMKIHEAKVMKQRMR